MFVFRPNERPKARRNGVLASPERLETRDLPALIVPIEPSSIASQQTGAAKAAATAPTTLQVQAIQRRGLHALPSRFTIIFNQALNPARASDPNNYLLVGEGPDLAVGTADDVPIRIRSVRYQAGEQTVTLTTARPVPLVGREYVLGIDGGTDTGVISADGDPLEGNDGPGTDLFSVVNVQNFVPPKALTRAIATPSGRGRTPATGVIRNG